jgi:hypothetical protein
MRRILMLTLVTCMLAAPASAGGFALFGSWYEANDRDDSGGVGGRIEIGDTWSFDLGVTWYGEVKGPFTGSGVEITEFRVLPVDVGVGYRFRSTVRVTPFVGAGASVFFLDTEPGRIDNQVGWYVRGGLDFRLFGNFYLLGEVFWREAEAEVKIDDGIDVERTDIDVGGLGFNLGVVWRF